MAHLHTLGASDVPLVLSEFSLLHHPSRFAGPTLTFGYFEEPLSYFRSSSAIDVRMISQGYSQAFEGVSGAVLAYAAR